MKQAATTATRDLTNSMQRQSAAVMERARSAAGRRRPTGRRCGARAARSQGRPGTERQWRPLELSSRTAARKDAAWQAFFKPKKVCDNPPDSDTQVECGNAYMRAKREFEERWERGDLR